MPKKLRAKDNGASAATVGFEAKWRAAADALRNNIDAAEYKHFVLSLGLNCVEYVSNAFAWLSP